MELQACLVICRKRLVLFKLQIAVKSMFTCILEMIRHYFFHTEYENDLFESFHVKVYIVECFLCGKKDHSLMSS